MFPIGNLLIPVSAHGGEHISNEIYIFGGSATIGNNIIEGLGTSLFYKVYHEAFYCSRGYYGQPGGNCSICEPGYYSSSYNSDSCSPCRPGTYSTGYGLGDFYQCTPCEYGTYTDKYASTRCYLCDFISDCPIGSSSPSIFQATNQISSSQPKNYDTNSSKASMIIFNFQIGIGVVVGIATLLFLILKQKEFFKKFDLFKDLHPRKYWEDPFPTTYGGFASVLFIIVALIFIVSPLVLFNIANITETKTLEPSVLFQYQRFTVKYLKLNLTLYNYGGACVVDGECATSMSLTSTGFHLVDASGPFCYSVTNGCSIVYICENCYMDPLTVFNITAVYYLIYASAIEIEFISSSSLPDFNTSSIKFIIVAPTGTVFNGPNPSVFYIDAIPSVFFI